MKLMNQVQILDKAAFHFVLMLLGKGMTPSILFLAIGKE